MATSSQNTTKNRDYHIRALDSEPRRLAKAGAAIAGIPIGSWIAQAVREKYDRDHNGREHNGSGS